MLVSLLGAVGDLVAASLSNLGSLYLTVEGVAKTHINNFITAKSHVLETLLGEWQFFSGFLTGAIVSFWAFR